MIKSIRLQNFFGFQDCTIDLEKGENVLVGMNGSGKSNFFKAIRLFSEIKERGRGISKTIIEDFVGIKKLQYSDKKRNSPYLTFKLDTIDMFESEDYSLFYQMGFLISSDFNDYNLIEKVWKIQEGREIELLRRNGENVYTEIAAGSNTRLHYDNRESCIAMVGKNEPDIAEIDEAANATFIYDYFDISNASDIKRGSPYRNESHLISDGRNLGPLLRQLSLNNKSAFNEIIDSLKKVNPNFRDIEFDSNPSSIHLLLDEGLETAIHATHISDGTLRFLCLMTILYNPNRGKIICIDEPELGLHPDMINTLYRAIQHAAEKSQIIISTHSAHLLDYFSLENIRVFEKDDNNATVVEQYAKEDFEGWYETFNPGQMWRAGDIGGNRWG